METKNKSYAILKVSEQIARLKSHGIIKAWKERLTVFMSCLKFTSLFIGLSVNELPKGGGKQSVQNMVWSFPEPRRDRDA